MGYIEAICISETKGVQKKEITKANILNNWGIETDAHGGNWHRQISLLAGESIDKVKNKIPNLKPGAFAENIVTRGIDLNNISVGDKIIINENVILEMTQRGKKCHTNCEIGRITGDCIMPKEGIFAKVISGGSIKKMDKITFLKGKE